MNVSPEEIVFTGRQWGDWQECYCPLHGDTTPSAGYNSRLGVLHCFVCGWHPVVEEQTYREESDRSEYISEVERRWSQLPRAADWPDASILRWYQVERGVRPEMFSFVGARLSANGTTVYIPSFKGNVLQSVRVRSERGRWIFGSPVPFVARSSGEDVRTIVCEGETDALALAQQPLPDGTRVVGTPGTMWKREWSYVLTGDVLILPQADEPSRLWAEKIRQQCPHARILWIPGGGLFKDWAELLHRWDAGPSELWQLLYDKPLPTYAELEWIRAMQVGQPLVPDVMFRGERWLFLGTPKSFKTTLVLRTLSQGMNRQPIWGVPGLYAEWNVVACVLREGGFHTWLRAIDPNQSSGWHFWLGPLSLDDPSSLEGFAKWLTTIRPDVIVLDPWSKFLSGDENEAVSHRRALDAIDRLRALVPYATWWIVHHTHKGVTQTPSEVSNVYLLSRGHSTLPAEVDGVVLIRRMDENTETVVPRVQVVIDGRSYSWPIREFLLERYGTDFVWVGGAGRG